MKHILKVVGGFESVLLSRMGRVTASADTHRQSSSSKGDKGKWGRRETSAAS